MKKLITFCILLFAFCILLCSCGNNEIALPDGSEQSTENIPDENGEDKESTFKESGESECKHVYEEKALVAATCQKEGIVKKTCTLCKKTESLKLPKAAHVEVEDKGKAATCTEAGTTDGKHCNVCGTVTVAQRAIPALGHTEVIDEAIPATCTTPGKTEGTHCDVCGTVTLAQETVTTGHSTIKRTHTPVSCKNNGAIEIYCTKCETVQNYETVLKGHYSSEHEYAGITHPDIGSLCVGYKAGDKCELCNTRFIAPGTYTITGNLTSAKDWIGKERFSFDYEKADKVYSAHSFDIVKGEDEYSNYSIEIDGETMEAFDSLVITITEENLAEVSDDFYNKVFLKYFEKGRYALSGKYMWYGEFELTHFIDIEQEINFTYTPKNSLSAKGTKITVIDQVAEIGVSKSVIRYDTYYQAAISWESDPTTEWIYNVDREIDFGEAPQTVSKEFFEWFTSVATKVVA